MNYNERIKFERKKEEMEMKVFLNDPIVDEAYARLAGAVDIVTNYDHPEELDGIMVRTTKVPREIIENAPKLKAIVMHGVGLDSIDVEAAREYGVPVFNVPGQSAESVAELALCGIMAAARNIKQANTGICESRYQHHGKTDLHGHEIFGRTLGLVGAGRIAQRLAQMMTAAFQVKVVAYDPYVDAKKLQAIGMKKAETVEELFAESDFVSVHVPLTPETKNLIGKSAFDAARENLILVSTARGGVVNEEELYRALKDKRVAGAFFDVFASEPPKGDNPLVHLENFIATPHIGGNTAECLVRVGNEAVDHMLKALGLME